MPDFCRAGAPDDDGRGGCRAFDAASGTPALLEGRSLLCWWCIEPRERDVRALVLDYRDLEQLLPPGLGRWSDGQPRAKSRPLPFAEHIFDLQLSIWWLLDAWDAAIRDAVRLPEKPSRTRQGWSVQQSVAILAPRLDVLAGLDPVDMWDYPGSADRSSQIWGWQGVLDLAGLHQHARSVLGLSDDRPALLLGVVCRNCDVKSRLTRDAETGEVRCTACKDRYTAVEYADWVAFLAAQQGREEAA